MKCGRMVLMALAMAGASLSLGLVPKEAAADANIMLIVDASGSMKKAAGNQSRMDAAKRVLVETLQTLPPEARLGLVIYGHRKAKDCSDMELVSPIGADSAAFLGERIGSLTAKGETPIAAALEMAAKSFSAFKGQQNSIVLVTDGVEECGGDPCAAARAIKETGLDLKVNVVGFTLSQEQKDLVSCVAEETGGTYFDAADSAALQSALIQVAEAATAPPDDNILAAANGGALLAAPSEEWLKLNDSSEDRATTYGGSAVWAFRDGRPATFDNFEVLIPATDKYNLKDFEILVGDDGPLGAFRSVGVFATQNIKMMQAPYQRFTFPPVTARYLKVVLKTDHGGGYIACYEFRVHGMVDDTAAGTESPTDIGGTNLIAATNGGVLLAAPSDEWLKLNDDNEDRATTYTGEAVWAFRDNQPATFSAFEVLIPAADQYNLKEFELFAGNDGPTGAFRSIGTFSTENIRMMQSPYQRFSFPPVSASFFKVSLKNDHGGGYIAAYEFRLIGKLGGEVPAAEMEPAARAAIDLLAPANGGVLIAAPNDEWLKLNDGSEERATTYAGEGIWGFKDLQPATFASFEILIPASDQYNVQEFELLAGDEGPGGPFTTIGTFATQNIKMMQSPYQKFTFQPTTARYLKVILKTDWGGGYIAAYEFHLLSVDAP